MEAAPRIAVGCDTGCRLSILESRVRENLWTRYRTSIFQTLNYWGLSPNVQATLAAISVEDIVAEEVVVLFVPDGELARSATFGQSLLKQLRLDVDDLNGRLVVVEP